MHEDLVRKRAAALSTAEDGLLERAILLITVTSLGSSECIGKISESLSLKTDTFVYILHSAPSFVSFSGPDDRCWVVTEGVQDFDGYRYIRSSQQIR